MMTDRLRVGFLLDRQWYLLRGEMETTKRPALIALAQLLAATGTPYAIIGGVALQVHQEEPRTTLDIDLAVRDLDALPRAELEAAGFRLSGRFVHSENWAGLEGVPVQFPDDPALHAPLDRALTIDLDGVPLRVIGRSDLLHENCGQAPIRRGAAPSASRTLLMPTL